MWERVELPGLSGPVCGFTFPQQDVFLVLTPDGLVRVKLNPVEVRLVADAEEITSLYDPHTELLPWEGERHLVYDADSGDITQCFHPSGDRIVPDSDGTMLITDHYGKIVRQRIPSIRIPSDGSWLYAGFSEDFKWLIAGEPRGVQVFCQLTNAEPPAAADGGA